MPADGAAQGASASVYMTVTLYLIKEWRHMAMEELFSSRTSLPRQCVSGKHLALNPCFPRPTVNLLLPRKPLRSCE